MPYIDQKIDHLLQNSQVNQPNIHVLISKDDDDDDDDAKDSLQVKGLARGKVRESRVGLRKSWTSYKNK